MNAKPTPWAADDRIVRRALRILEQRARMPEIALDTTTSAANWFRLRLAELPHEVFAVAWLDNKLRLIEFCELFVGTTNFTGIHPREVVRSALRCNAVSGIFAHNHPSGDASASPSDIEVTENLRRALALIDVRVVDHLIVTAGMPPFSMADAGLIAKTNFEDCPWDRSCVRTANRNDGPPHRAEHTAKAAPKEPLSP